jgi:hypothetical protein
MITSYRKLLIVALLLAFAGCADYSVDSESGRPEKVPGAGTPSSFNGYVTRQIPLVTEPLLTPKRFIQDECEYLEFSSGVYKEGGVTRYAVYAVTHKGNCSNVVHQYRYPHLQYFPKQ